MEINVAGIFSQIISILLYTDSCLSWTSVYWHYIVENNECPLLTTTVQGMFQQNVDVEFATECARQCTNTDNCIVFQFDSSLKTCDFYSKLIPAQVGAPSTDCIKTTIKSYRKHIAGCTGPGYVYDDNIGLCVSFSYTFAEAGNWDMQKANCEGKGESLIVINSNQKYDLIKEIIKSSYTIGLFLYSIGGKKENGTWYWLNGDLMPVSLDYWDQDPYSYPSTYTCAVMGNSWFYNYKWVARECATTYYQYLCEKPMP